ncbi:GNAT family N-acetyltransferase [Natrarchaeobius oligotrophus]|uniref:N-acetyltransferase n=1 Tax=Natrarchaeobius chitinivorans TaxID=1679083 RepID=A0A3N6MYG4_NATCH|nr:N-acetyltransferase [Natrarchaeobius chitinivorans]
MFPQSIETDRLRLESIRSDRLDVLELYEICSSDPGIDEVTAHLTWSPHETPKETLEFVTEARTNHESGETGTYVIRPRDGEAGAGEIAGLCGFETDWKRRTMSLGIWLRRRFWGRGYSSERAAAFVALAFERLGLDLVSVSADVENERSNRAIRTYVDAHGGRRDGLVRNWIVVNGEPTDCYRYSISRTEWRESGADVAVTFLE